MKVKQFILFFTLLFFVNGVLLFAQEGKKLYKGFGIEVGVGANVINSKTTFIQSPPGSYSISHQGTLIPIPYMAPDVERTKLFVQPTARIYYSFRLYRFLETVKLKMPVFIGYYSFGSKTVNTIFLDDPTLSQPTTIIDLFRTLEFGINPCIDFKKLQIGLLLKEQYIFSATERIDMVGGGHPSYWTEVYKSKDYKNFAMSTGMKLKYSVKGFSIAAEMWFGLTNLTAHQNIGFANVVITENNCRFLFGYEF